MLLGREKELAILTDAYAAKTSKLVVVYGRRRIGKSSLIATFLKNKRNLCFESLERQSTSSQISHFKNSLSAFTDDKLLPQIKFINWDQVFTYLTERLRQETEKVIIFFDEFQWMAAGQTKLVALIKYYWDNHWKNLNIQLILCGSIANYMVNRVIKSKALYGRIDLELLITELKPFEIAQFFPKTRSQEEILTYMLILGGVPKYYELLEKNRSLEKNLATLCFEKSGYLFNEYEKIFFSQFKEHLRYEEIVKFISHSPKTLSELAKRLKMPSGGGLKRYLNNLELARFIRAYTPIQKQTTNIVKYGVFDEYLNFYFKFILPRRNKIVKDIHKNIFASEIKNSWLPWLGLAFERFCLRYANLICEILKISDVTEDFGPLFFKGDTSFQIDLVIKRSDRVWNLCECKFNQDPVGVEIIPEFNTKIEKIKLPRGYSIEKTLISPSGMTDSLSKTEYFDSCVTIRELFDRRRGVEQ